MAPRNKARGKRKPTSTQTVKLCLYPLGRTPLFSNPRSVTASRQETWYNLLTSPRLGLGHNVLNDGVIVCSQGYTPSKPQEGKGWKAHLHEKIGVSLKRYKTKRTMDVYKVRVGKPFLPGNCHTNLVNPVLPEAIPGTSHANSTNCEPLLIVNYQGDNDERVNEDREYPESSFDDDMDDDRTTVLLRDPASMSVRTTDSMEDNELRNQGIYNDPYFRIGALARFKRSNNATLLAIKEEILRVKNNTDRHGWEATVRRMPLLMNHVRDVFLDQ